ncbi:MAG TPA: hypothetical protein VJO15_02890, partial [Dehalococcoidia bacterium]|nr:hypothetical protein [Dehalococcoidia bacterium]
RPSPGRTRRLHGGPPLRRGCTVPVGPPLRAAGLTTPKGGGPDHPQGGHGGYTEVRPYGCEPLTLDPGDCGGGFTECTNVVASASLS